MDPSIPAQTPPPVQVINPAPAVPESPATWKLIVTILTLIIFTPLGIILMWVWMKSWSKWLKLLLTFIFIVLLALLVMFFINRFNQDAAQRLESTSQQATNPPVVSDSTQIATGSADLINFDSPCMSFKYPANFSKTTEVIVKDHDLVEGKDQFGSTDILLSKEVGGNTYNLNLACNNPPASSNAKSDVGILMMTGAYKDSGSVQNLKIGNIDATKISINNTGVIIITGYGKNYHFYIRAVSQGLKLDDPQNEISKDLDVLVESMTLKDIFK